jgi:mannose-6-phosphate isomerase-like protein (cupin superfamily)
MDTTTRDAPRGVRFDLADLALNATAALFEGHPRAGVDITIFVVRTPPGRWVDLHVHPYAETFLLLEGRGRWTRGDEVVELEPDQILVVPPETPHGFRNVGDEPLLVVSVHERGTLQQTWLGREPA